MLDKDKIEEIIFRNSKEINDIIKDILAKARVNALTPSYHNYPGMLAVYESNQDVKKLCVGELQYQKLAKAD
jgi:hypothetical protein